ncbi:MAG: glycoside hydrolase family 13 protein [Acidobacteriaceae bacterium]
MKHALARPLLAGAMLLCMASFSGCERSHPAQSKSGNFPAVASASRNDPWWKHAVIYEVYPRSFQDSNGDGVGDLNGITDRLDYLQGLGVNAIWLTPIYPSPQHDFGYDISNYEAIDPMYGTLQQFDRLVAEAKKRNIRVIMDLVMNHTSDQHPWFQESRSSRNNPKRDWYVWRDGKGPGIPPNNWQSDFGHSAWTYDAKTKQWYYHKFEVQQPDLNWNNPEVQKAMFNIVRFWLDRGVAGFRLDAITCLFEDPQFRDEKVLPGKNEYGDPNIGEEMTNNLPQVHDVLRALRKVTDSYPGNRVLIGETYLPNIQELLKMYGSNHDESQLPMDLQVGFIDKLDVNAFRQKINEAEIDLDGNQPLFVFDNHDRPRSWDRYGDGVHNAAIARILAAILFTTRSTAMMYYGEELGMVTTTPKTKAEVQDPWGKIGWPKEKGRDGERTPMQWTPGKNAGFSTADKTWLPVAPDYNTVNVEVESNDPHSLYHWYQALIAIRRNNPALRNGDNIMLNTSDSHILSYLRKNPGNGASVLVAINFTAQPHTVSFQLKPLGIDGSRAKTLLQDSSIAANVPLHHLELPPFAVYIGQVQ